ncbi:MAG: D-sedoheptulose 7-phosphate isomerase [Calditrichia bacterium]
MKHPEWENIFDNTVRSSIETKQQVAKCCREEILRAAIQMVQALKHKGKIMICGNGGSAADAQHIAAELVVRLKSSNNRPAIPALALSVDTSIITAGGNDFGFDHIFSRQIEALGNHGDVLLAISTSGNSPNVVEAVNMAHEKGMYVIGLLGKDGGKLKKLVDLPIIVPSADTARVQESHIMIGHLFCDLIEREIFPV